MKRMRIFVSSTFQDLQEERNLLINSTFQKLRYEANKSGVSLEVIDLRWGVPSSEEAATINWCLELADACRPYLLAIVGGRAGWTPTKPGNKTITELELERFLHRQDIGLSDARALALFKSVEDDRQVRGIRAMLREAQHVDVYEYSRFPEIQEIVDAHFSREIDKLSRSEARHEPMTIRNAALPQPKSAMFPDETAAACDAISSRRVAVLDSMDSIARVLTIRDISVRLREAGNDLIYVDVAAEALATSGALVARLKNLGLIATGESNVPPEHLCGKTLAIEGLDSLVDFERSAHHADTLLLSGLLRQLGQSHSGGLGLLIAADFTKRPNLINIWGEEVVLRIRMQEAAIRDLILCYFEAAGKQLSQSQTAGMVEYALNNNLPALEILLRCDQLRRTGVLKENDVSQDVHVESLVRNHFTNGASNGLAGEIIENLMGSLSPDRHEIVLDALAILTGLHFGAGFTDLEATGLTAFEWGVLRAMAGGALVGDLHRVRLSRQDIRAQFEVALGTDRVNRTTRGMLSKKLEALRTAKTLNEWYEFNTVLASDLLFQNRWWDDSLSALALFDARVWPALVCYDPGFFSQHILGTILTDARIAQIANARATVPEADQQILGLASLAEATALQGAEHHKALDEALDQAERSLNIIVPPSGSAMAVQSILTGYAICRARYVLDKQIDKLCVDKLSLYLSYALEFQLAAIGSEEFRLCPGSERAILLARKDVVLWFLHLVEGRAYLGGTRRIQLEKMAATNFDSDVCAILDWFSQEHRRVERVPFAHVELPPEQSERLRSWLNDARNA